MKFKITQLSATKIGSLAILLAVDEEGHKEPVDVVGSADEALEMAEYDFRRREREMENDEGCPLCPYEYEVWGKTYTGMECLAKVEFEYAAA